MRTVQRLLAALAFLALAACAGDDKLDHPVFDAPTTSIDYTVELDGLPSEDMTDLATASLAVYRQQDAGAQSTAFLKRRAEGDAALLHRILRSKGYYNGEVDVDVKPPEGETPTKAIFVVRPGTAFTLARHDFTLDDPSGTAPALNPSELGSPVGQAAEAAAIVDAETGAVEQLRRTGFPYAERGKRRAVADLDAEIIEIDTPVSTGPASQFGELSFSGLQDVQESYLATYVPWEIGETFNTSKLRTYQRALIGTDLFETVRVTPPATPPDAPGPVPLPITVEAIERPFRTVSAGALYNTDDGPSVTGSYEHRNLFGANETVTVAAELGLELQVFGVAYREPQYLRPSQDFFASFSVKREEDDAFDDLTGTLTAGIQRKLNPRWTVGFGGLLEASLITDQGDESTAFLGGIPLSATYDGSDDPLNPTKGARLNLEVTPFAGSFNDAFASFLSLDATESAYYDITNEKDYILAARGRLGSILAGDLDDVPQTRRLYSGGGGSVRGFARRFVGPLDANNDPTGGLSAMELGLEARARLYGDLGGVLFLEAGSVTEQSFPNFDEGIQTAAGAGFRYFSPAGPIRVDIAFPLDPRDVDDTFQFYFSIGQAF